MAAMTDGVIQISVVWLPADWEHPPVQGGESAFSLTGQGEAELCQACFSVANGLPVEQFLETHLTKSARDQLANRSRGVSIRGRRLTTHQRLCSQDRIELLGPISADPKSERRARVNQERAQQMNRRWRRAN